ncbi:hypothetical protein [Paraclostridium sordellii]|uniref:hypothetical protein n=1 Tax=Paraclostridium sordellii TaxID=1505 RepID=UPI0005DF55A5|nr:hypothetical protein [Paeniclostridium sordellii]CEN87620.1 Uncharacterised protein [[Clostridium] sordellii] [Paeniclostridium sordellii]
MWKLDKPTDCPELVFKTCVNNKKDINLRKNLLAYSTKVKNSSTEFENLFLTNQVHKLNKYHDVFNNVPSDEWPKIYTGNFAKKKSPGRVFYDKLLSIPKYSLCPLCAQRDVSTLDHYLPKTVFPTLVVSPLNLIASCSNCNKLKGDSTFDSMYEATIHPYFDDIDTDTWLFAEILRGDDISFRFFVSCPESWPELLCFRLKNHFDTFELNKLYSAHASQDIVSIKYKLINLYAKYGLESVKLDIQECIESLKHVSKNNWRLAMYRELSTNDWFLNEWLPNQVRIILKI